MSFSSKMTDEQLKSLALVVITALVHELASSFRSLREELLPFMPNQDEAASTMHTLDQMEPLHEQAQTAIEQMKKDFGLEDLEV